MLAEIARALDVRFFDLRDFLFRQLPEEPLEVLEETAIQLELPFEAVARISCERVGNNLLVRAAVTKKRER